jgi:hypothetical protein
MSPRRKTALVAGVLYLLTFVSIPTLFLYGQVKSANYILGAGGKLTEGWTNFASKGGNLH